MIETPKVKSIAPWFGGKRAMAKRIVELLGDHSAYWEPFCGSMAVLFAKPPSAQETVCDLHGDLINLAHVLASDDAVALYERLCRILPCTGLYQQWRDAAPPSSPLDRAVWFMVISWMGRNGTSGTYRSNYQPSIRFTPGGGSTSTRWRSAVESIPAWHERLRNVLIVNRDAFEVLEKIADDTRVAIYADPPYVASSTSGSSRYKHDFTADDHSRLAESLGRFKRARVVVSYYDCETVRALYDGWTFVECSRQKNLHVQNKRGTASCVAPELLITNKEGVQ